MRDALPTVPYTLTRVGVVMTPEAGQPARGGGRAQSGFGAGPDGEVYLLPRLVAAGNVSRIGLARVVVEDGVPVGVEREGVVLEPDRSWERGVGNAGVEDPRITWMADLGLHVMTYVAYGPLGPRTALAVSEDLREWRRLGPVLFTYDDALDIDLNLFHNKDTVFFPEPVTAPDGVRCFAVLHRPMWDLIETKAGSGRRPARGHRRSAAVDLDQLRAGRGGARRISRRSRLWSQHRFLAGPAYPVRGHQDRRRSRAAARAGGLAAAPPRRHRHASSSAFDHQQNVNYAAGAMLLDADDPSIVHRPHAEPLLSAETEEERSGIVPNVVFPTAIEEIDGVHYVFYGMADSKIGVGERLEHA